MSTWTDRFAAMSHADRVMTIVEDGSTLQAFIHEAQLNQDWYRRWRLAREADPPTQPADINLDGPAGGAIVGQMEPTKSTGTFDLDSATDLERGLYNMGREVEQLPASALQTRLSLILSTAMIELWRLRTRAPAPAPTGAPATCTCPLLSCPVHTLDEILAWHHAAPALPPAEMLQQSCRTPAPDRSGRSCDRPAGHDGEHWTYGGHTLSWASPPAERPQETVTRERLDFALAKLQAVSDRIEYGNSAHLRGMLDEIRAALTPDGGGR